MKKVFNAILNFFKMIILYIINFFLSLFPDRNKKEIKKTDIKANIPSEKNETKPVYFEGSATNRDENNTSELIKPEKTFIEENNKYTKKQLYLISLIDKKIDDYIEKEEDIKIKDLDLETEKELKKLKEKITPLIIKDISADYIRTEHTLEKEVAELLKIELLEHPIFPLKEVKEDTITENLSNNKTEEIVSDHIELKEEVTNLIKSSAIIIANVTKEVLTSPKKEQNKEKPKELEPQTERITPSSLSEEPTILIASNEPEIQKTNQTFNEEEEKKETYTPLSDTENEIIIEDIKKDEIIPKEEIISYEPIKDKPKVESQKTEAINIQEKNASITNEETKNINIINLTPIQESTNQIIDFTKEDCKKKEIEDKNYETVEEEIDKMLNQITMFMLKYENKLTPEQKEQLNNELNRLRDTKEKMIHQKEIDIKEEEKNLTSSITNDEINGLKAELQKMDIEQQIELNNEKLKKVEELEHLEKKATNKIEKKLLKKKLKKSSRLLALTSLLSLPFVRNKYFFYFTIGTLVNYNFRLIDSLINHQSIKDKPQLPDIKKGQDALYEAINTTNENMIYLNTLEQDILIKHPDLSLDSEYLLTIRSLKNKLAKTEEKLKRKQEVLDKYCHKNIKYKKILKNEQF